MDAVGISALLGRCHFGLTVRILAQINVVCQEGLRVFRKYTECGLRLWSAFPESEPPGEPSST
jgi:hypothetical protein